MRPIVGLGDARPPGLADFRRRYTIINVNRIYGGIVSSVELISGARCVGYSCATTRVRELDHAEYRAEWRKRKLIKCAENKWSENFDEKPHRS